jgi:hypothetical protein
MLTLAQTLLLLLPLTTPALAHNGIDHGNGPTPTTTSSLTTAEPSPGHVSLEDILAGKNNKPNARRDIGDSFKSLFGDPAAMINSLSKCTTACGAASLEAIKCTADDGTDCACKNGGQDWADAAKAHFGSSKPRDCEDGDKLDEGALTKICKAVADKPDKKKDADRAVKDKFSTGIKGVMNDIFGGDGSDSEDEDEDGVKTKVTVNGKEISGAGGAPAPGTVARAAGGALAAVVGYAVAML